MPHLYFDEMQQPETKTEFSSRQILEKVMDVAKIQRERFKKTASQTNSDMSRRQIEIFCKLDKTSNKQKIFYEPQWKKSIFLAELMIEF